MHFASYYRWLVYSHLFRPPAPDATLLDIGSDDGGFGERLAVRSQVALDLSLASLSRSSAPAKVCADGTRMPFATATFDHVILSDVIEHVPDDACLLAQVTARVRPGGRLWLSTTASQFTLFPPPITARAERAWGHVRKGYTPDRLRALFPADFHLTLIEWHETTLRHTYLLPWAASKQFPALARTLAWLCFQADLRRGTPSTPYGHLYVEATRQQA